jgi:uncharacterized protein (UPF0332 family)
VQFKDWATSKKLTEHTSSYAELTDLLTLADNRLNDCEKMLKAGVSADTCFGNVYEAALPCAKAILAASGYRIGQDVEGGHNLLFQALSFTVDTKGHAVSKLQAARKQRQQITYTSVANLDQKTVEELLRLVEELRRAAEAWLKKNHADLMTPPKPKATAPAAPVPAAPSVAPAAPSGPAAKPKSNTK